MQTRYTLCVCGVLALLFILVPALEIIVLIEVGSWLGSLPTLAVIVATGIAGAALARHQGMAALNDLRASLEQGRQIGSAAVGAVLVLVAGIAMLTPGFVTDALGLLLLVPPLRHRVASVLARRYAARAAARVIVGPFGHMPGEGGPWAPPGGPHGPGRQPRGRDSGPDDRDPPPPGVIDV